MRDNYSSYTVSNRRRDALQRDCPCSYEALRAHFTHWLPVASREELKAALKKICNVSSVQYFVHGITSCIAESFTVNKSLMCKMFFYSVLDYDLFLTRAFFEPINENETSNGCILLYTP